MRPDKESRRAKQMLSRRAALAVLAGASRSAAYPGAVDAQHPLRLSISETVVGDVNVNDARAAMVVWIKRITQDLNMSVRISPSVFDPSERIFAMLRDGHVDTVAANIFEYRRMAEWLDPNQVMVPSDGTKLQYVLLVRSEGGPTTPAQLKGKRILILRAPNTCLAPAWLANVLREEAPGGIERFFGSVTSETKPARVMLPVFFGQADACLTTGRSFTTMGELNPQVGRRLRPLLTSPEVVATMYAFRRNYSGRSRELLIRALADLHSTAAGRQVLALFQLDKLVARDTGCLSPSLEILAQADRVGRVADGGSGKGARE